MMHTGDMKITRTNRDGKLDRSWSLEAEVDRTLARVLFIVVVVALAVLLWRIGFPGWRFLLPFR